MTTNSNRMPESPLRLRVQVPAALAGRSLAEALAVAGRMEASAAAAVVRFGAVRLNGTVRTDPDVRVGRKDRLQVHYEPVPATPEPEIVYREEDFLVVLKPAGMPVQGTRLGSGNSLESWLAREVAPGRPRILHRLDLPVSGLLVVPLGAPGARALTRAFEEGTVHKVYQGITRPTPEGRAWLPGPESGPRDIDAPLRWLAGKQRAVVSDAGKPALTRVWCPALPSGSDVLVELELVTGRTHQARVHLAHVGLPLLGDAVYGIPGGNRVALHAMRLAFPHPRTGAVLEFERKPGEDFWAVN